VGRVGADDDGFEAALGTAERSGSGYTGFTDTAFAGMDDYTHGHSLTFRLF
jgi:hypothetical protein